MARTLEPCRLAPCGVVRAAAWPLEAMSAFGEPELNATGDQRSGGTAVSATFERCYQETLARERTSLWDQTHDDPLFLKALLLSSPSAYLRSQSAAERRAGPRNRAMRLVEHTLYRYLARAVGRVTPLGLWAGVSELRIGNTTRFERVPARADFTPDLRPFQDLIRSLGMRDEYRDRTAWRLNPSIQLNAHDRCWAFTHRSGRGELEQRRLSFDRELSRILDHLATFGPQPLTAIAQTLASTDLNSLDYLPLLRELANGGVLVGGLDLPTKFASAWEALDIAAARLLPDDRRVWRQAIATYREHCGALGDGVWSMAPCEFAEALAKPRATITSLAQQLGLAPPPMHDTVRCDFRLPWRLTLDRNRFHALRAAYVDYDRHWQRGISAATSEREDRRRWFAAQLGSGCTLADASALVAHLGITQKSVWPAPSAIASAEVAARLGGWEACLMTAASRITLDITRAETAPPAAGVGCWLAGLGTGEVIRAHGVSDLPSIASARYTDILDLSRHNLWLRAALAASVRFSGVGLAALFVPYEANPNALASPKLLDTAIAPWSAETDTQHLYAARLCVEPASGQPVLRLAGDKRAWAVTALATANLQAADPLVEALLWTGFRDSPGRAGRAVDIPTAAEIARTHFTPRIMLPRGAVLSARRTVLTTELAALRQRRGADRFRIWQRLANRYDWPPLLEVSSDRGGALLVPRDSPLAVEAMCKGLGDGVTYVMVQESPPGGGLAIPGNGTHMTEVAIPFMREVATTAPR